MTRNVTMAQGILQIVKLNWGHASEYVLYSLVPSKSDSKVELSKDHK
jgi:hypothetical protein